MLQFLNSIELVYYCKTGYAVIRKLMEYDAKEVDQMGKDKGKDKDKKKDKKDKKDKKEKKEKKD